MKTPAHCFLRGLTVISVAGLFACASTPKADFPAGTDPRAKLTEVEARLTADRGKQIDVLSPQHFSDAQDAIKEAHQKLEKGKSSEDALNATAKAAGNLDTAEANAAKYTPTLQTVLDARQAALNAKANTAVPNKFQDADKDFYSFGKDIENNKFTLNAEDTSKLQGKYAAVELLAIKQTNLGESKALIENARDNGGNSKTPKTLSEAEVQYDSAIRSIEANRRNPAGFKPSVDQANASAHKLDAVLKTVKTTGATEVAAVQIYDQQQQLASTSAALTASQAAAAASAAQVGTLSGQNKQYADKAAMNAKIEQIKAEFSPQEAEVLRDGSKIIIRLKSMQFKTAKFDLTPGSLDTLQKVKEMITAVPYDKVIVEGHTDSVGGPAKNQVLSQKRAEAIKKYFVAENTVPADKVEAEGFGYQKPLASNKTAKGRATNRRVDVVIDSTVTQ